MLTNDQMIPNRFARLARARKVWSFITTQTEAGRTVHAANYLSVVKLTQKTVASGAVRLRGFHVEIARGKKWDSIMGCKFSALS